MVAELVCEHEWVLVRNEAGLGVEGAIGRLNLVQDLQHLFEMGLQVLLSEIIKTIRMYEFVCQIYNFINSTVRLVIFVLAFSHNNIKYLDMDLYFRISREESIAVYQSV